MTQSASDWGELGFDPALLDALPIPFIIGRNESQLRLVYVNRRFTEAYGYAIDDIPTVFAWAEQACPDADYRRDLFARWDQSVRAAIEAGGEVAPLEADIRTRVGERRTVKIEATVIGSCTLTSFVDITSVRQVEAALQTAERSLQQVALDVTENIPVGTYTMIQPPEGGMARFSFMSPRFLELTGLDREAAKADPLSAFACVHPDDLEDWVAKNAETFEKKVPFFGETRVINNGEVRWITAESNPRQLPDGSTVWEGVLADITARKNAEAQLVEAKQRAERLERAKSEFLANMSHEIRTPMNAVLGIAELLDAEPLGERQQELVGRLRDAGELLVAIINDVLDLSKIEAGKLPIRKRYFSIHEQVQKIIGLYLPLAEEKSITLRLRTLPSAIPDPLFGDFLRLQQVIGNLLSNAIKFTDQGEVQLGISIHKTTRNEITLRFEVTDTGIGMTLEEQRRLFDPFEQANQRNDEISGTGLGLSISHRLVELMGGSIAVESHPEKGSRFWFLLPFGLPNTEMVGKAVAPRPLNHPANALQRRRVLVVDDGELNRYVAAEFIKAAGGECVTADGAEAALHCLKNARQPFHAVLVDIQMPGVDGFNLSQIIRQDLGLGGLPIIGFTAAVISDQRRPALDAEMDDILLKPFSRAELIECLGFWCSLANLEPQVLQPNQIAPTPGINRDHAAATIGDDAEQFEAVMRVFAKEFSTAANRLREMLERNDVDGAMRLVHSIRGAAAQVGALRLSSLARALELAIKDGRETEDLLLSFEFQLRRVLPD